MEEEQTILLKLIGFTIQNAHFEYEGASAWMMDYFHLQTKSGDWFRVHFDHTAMNGVQVCEWITSNCCGDGELCAVDTEGTTDHGTIWIERLRLDLAVVPCKSSTFIGPADITAKEVIRTFGTLYPHRPFYVPVDMSHVVLTACLLNFTFTKSHEYFEESWGELSRLKKTPKEKFLYFNDSSRVGISPSTVEVKETQVRNEWWRQYLSTQLAWVSFIRSPDLPHSTFFKHYTYDTTDLQGVGVIVSAVGSFWSFSFYQDPSMIEEFIHRFRLVACYGPC